MDGSRRIALTRRSLLRNGALGLASFYCDLGTATPSSVRTSAAKRAVAGSPFEPFRTELPLPPVLRPVRRTRSADHYVVTMRETHAELLPGFDTPVYAYEGIVPGPTIRARAGRRVMVEQRNALGETTNVHLHGARAPASSDGHPRDVIPAGASRLYDYPNRQAGATLWYHDHTHHRQAETVYKGLAAFYLVREDLEDELELPRGSYELPLMIADKSFNADGSLRYERDLNNGFLGDTMLVNGAVQPCVRVERQRYRLRFLNASNARDLELSLSDGSAMTQIASDGGLLPRSTRQRRIRLSSAERVEVVVDFRLYRPGTKLILRNLLGSGSTASVMRFDVVRSGAEDFGPVPRTLKPMRRLPRVSAVRDVVLDRAVIPQVEWQLNGLGFDMDRIDTRARLGTTELWRFVNRSTHVHPMHIHGFFFRVLARGSRRPPASERGWKDTVRVDPNETVTVMPYFSGYPGAYVYHCHKLEHGDNAMMAQMEVTA